jgi:hypothetical protein
MKRIKINRGRQLKIRSATWKKFCKEMKIRKKKEAEMLEMTTSINNSKQWWIVSSPIKESRRKNIRDGGQD